MVVGRSRQRCLFVIVGALAGCGAQSLVPQGDGMGDGGTPPATIGAAPVVRLAQTTLLTNADLTTAKVLAADGDGIYWVTGDNQLWMLATGSDTPRQLAADSNPMRGSNDYAALMAKGNALFWTASILAPSGQYLQSPLHRTQKTGGDVVLALTSNDGGFIYAPGTPALEGDQRFSGSFVTHLHGPWWSWSTSTKD